MSYDARNNALGAFVNPKSVTQAPGHGRAMPVCLAEWVQPPELRYSHGQIRAGRQQVQLGG